MFNNITSFRKLAFTAAFGLMLAGSAMAQGPKGQILNRMDAHYKALTSLRSNVTMVKVDAALDDATTQEGSVSYLPKTAKRVMYARVDWTTPTENMVVIGDDYLIFRPTLKQAYKGKTSQAKDNSKIAGPLAFVSMSKEQLTANYEVVYVGEEQITGGTKTWHLLLTPKAKSNYKTAELWVDGDGMPRQFKVTSNNNDTMSILLTNIQKNVTIDASSFKLKLPSNVVPMKT